MARYTEAVCRLCRRSGDKLMIKGARCFTPKCAMERRNKPPGQHGGGSGRPRRISDRGLQLREKQKARHTYGMLERQFRNLFSRAERQSGVTGDNLLALLERRLDNVVYRLGFADSRSQARQIVQHGHITLNGRRTNVPSCLVKEGDVVGWREQSAKSAYYQQMEEAVESKVIPNWLMLDKGKMEGQVTALPNPDDVEAAFSGQSIVEYYSR